MPKDCQSVHAGRGELVHVAVADRGLCPGRGVLPSVYRRLSTRSRVARCTVVANQPFWPDCWKAPTETESGADVRESDAQAIALPHSARGRQQARRHPPHHDAPRPAGVPGRSRRTGAKGIIMHFTASARSVDRPQHWPSSPSAPRWLPRRRPPPSLRPSSAPSTSSRCTLTAAAMPLAALRGRACRCWTPASAESRSKWKAPAPSAP